MDKITAQVAANSKNQFDKFIQASSFEHKESFLKFKFTEDRLDTFLGLYVANESQFKDLWHICKIKFILSHGQSSVERGFSVNKEVLQDNLQETSLNSQRLVYNTLQSNNSKPQEFIITKDLRKSCVLWYQKYKLEWQKAAEKKTKSTRELKRKQKFDEIENIKKQKLTLQTVPKTTDSQVLKNNTLHHKISRPGGRGLLQRLSVKISSNIRYAITQSHC